MVVLRDYGIGASVTDLLEVTESSLASCLTAVNLGEDGAASGYNQMTQLVSITKAVKEKDVKYLSREQTSLSREGAEAKGDLGSMSEELNAASEYEEKLKQRCIAKPDSYEERKRRREEELQGLQEALAMLNGDGISFVQRDTASSPDLADEAAEVSRFMENVRAKTEVGGGRLDAKPASDLVPTPSIKKAVATQPHVSALDAELLAKADQVAREMGIGSAGNPVAQPPAVLAKRAEAAVHKRLGHSHAAARFFAVHGMTNIGHLLGEELTASERESALREETQGMRALGGKPSTRAAMPSRSAAANAGGADDELDLEMAEDEDERADQAQWKAVEKLKHRMPQQM